MALVADMAFGHLRECRSLAVGCGVVGEIVRYTYRLRPGARAERALMAEWHRCRWLWNEAVHQQKSGRKPTLCKLSLLLTAARERSAWPRRGRRSPSSRRCGPTLGRPATPTR